MTVPDASESSQTDGEGPDSSDKPPHDDPTSRPHKTRSKPVQKPVSNGLVLDNTTLTMTNHTVSVPLPSPEAGAYPKEPGNTRSALEILVLAGPPHDNSTSTLDSAPSSVVESSDSECTSAPSSRAPSQAPSRIQSRAPSLSGTPKDKAAAINAATKKEQTQPTPVAASLEPPASTARSRAPSVASTEGSHKFNLKDLLSGGPKLGRKASGGSSRKSDSENGDSKSNAGSTASLSKKYGVCQKLAIGKGATSVVRLAHKWDRTEEKLYAVKEFRKRRKNESEKEYVKKLTAEFCISSTLHHINIVETVDLVQDEAQHWCEVMEFCPGGDLYAAIKKGSMSPSEAECCFKQILTGVSYLHSQGVAHRDIKPENLFFDMKGHLKIGDYGASTVYRLPWETTIHMSTGLCGSEPYIAPEQFLGKPYDARLVDIWACGIVYYCLHFQELPWRVAQNTDQLYGSYASACHAAPAASAAPGSFPPTINNLNPRACRSLMRKMLDPDPKLRSPIEEVMKHSWMQSIEVCHMVAKPSHVHVHARSLAEGQV
ncbi:hypothetical protein PILCRDRAFT_821096 [Piloderma croceum F 1598]|uniref:non-specific serine/threonine protein kinase n=1 Tax=Piloderma croceum (strain F 1598) TaxID=765440 RepID=A0A0C3FAS3_PILCF|nr:hypothetical protein PILCRDRAFT_821096 [Piloderma croceum F 1598]